MKRVLSLLVLLLFIINVVSGCSLENKLQRNSNNIEKEIQKNGGVSVILKMDDTNENKPTDIELETVKSIITYRLHEMGFMNNSISVDDKGEIIVNLTDYKELKDDKLQQTLDNIFKRGLLTVQEIDESKKDSNGLYLSTGKVIFSSKEILKADSYDGKDGKTNIQIKLNNEAAINFEKATERLIGKPLGIFMDDKLISAPTVATKITGGNLVIAGQKDKNDTLNMVITIRSGVLPFKLVTKEIKTISPAN